MEKVEGSMTLRATDLKTAAVWPIWRTPNGRTRYVHASFVAWWLRVWRQQQRGKYGESQMVAPGSCMLLLWLGGYGFFCWWLRRFLYLVATVSLFGGYAGFFCGLVATDVSLIGGYGFFIWWLRRFLLWLGGYGCFFYWWLRFLYLVATQVSLVAWWLRMFLLLVATVSLFGGYGCFFCDLVATVSFVVGYGFFIWWLRRFLL